MELCLFNNFKIPNLIKNINLKKLDKMPRKAATKSRKSASKGKKRATKKSTKRSRSRTVKPKKKKAKKVVRKAKKVKRVSKIAKGRLAKAQVFKGRKAKTVGGLKKSDITRNKHGKYVSKKMSKRGKQSGWIKAVMRARKAMKVTGFCAVGGKSA